MKTHNVEVQYHTPKTAGIDMELRKFIMLKSIKLYSPVSTNFLVKVMKDCVTKSHTKSKGSAWEVRNFERTLYEPMVRVLSTYQERGWVRSDYPIYWELTTLGEAELKRSENILSRVLAEYYSKIITDFGPPKNNEKIRKLIEELNKERLSLTYHIPANLKEWLGDSPYLFATRFHEGREKLWIVVWDEELARFLKEKGGNTILVATMTNEFRDLHT